MSLKHRLFSAGFGAIAATGADRRLSPFARGRGVILMLHHVRPWQPREFAPNRVLEITPEFLDFALSELRREGFDIIPLDAVPDRLRRSLGGQPFAALSFDDGYRDNVEHARPVLMRHRAPWTVFITTDFAEGKGRLWWVELEQTIAVKDRVTLALGGEQLDLPTRTAREKQTAFDIIHACVRAGPQERMRELIASLAAEAEAGADSLAADLCLNWDEIQSLAGEPDVSIGAHTISHPILAQLDPAAAAREIGDGKARLEGRLGRQIRHLAFPFGDPAAVGVREVRLARQAGFVTAVTSRPGHVFADHGTHLHALPRVSINGLFQSESAFRALLSGVPFLAWNRRRVVQVEAEP
ncbi:MAG TPA: polysaccharide deacetylase family protein [Pseudolabrys sp.]|jgi:peptidoglycan/xylan/chitin deacetylase (PgdA/CDA1 family)